MVVHTPREGPRTTLQKHLDYFDADHDDVITLLDSYRGFRDMAYPVFMAMFAAFIIHLPFSYPTLPKFNPNGEKLDLIQLIITLPARIWSYVPDPFLKIYLNTIHKDVHGSDSQTYNTEGGFESVKFDEIFEKYSTLPHKDGLTVSDTVYMWRDQWRLLDVFGPVAGAAEWFALWYTLWPASGVITKDDLKGTYDGSIFYKLAHERTGTGSKTKSR